MASLTLVQAGRVWLDFLPTAPRRRSKPPAPNTLRVYGIYLRRIIRSIGNIPLESLTNRVIRDYVSELKAEGYSASTIIGHENVILSVVQSLKDENGDSIYHLKLNHDFIGSPLLEPGQQNSPCATTADIERALAESGQIAGIVAVASGAGLRISEILALSDENTGTNDCLDFEQSMIHVRTVLKTPAAKRDLPIPSELAEFLKPFCNSGPRVFDLSRSEIYRQLSKLSLPPCHSYRRFRITHCRKTGMSEELLKYLAGHSNPGVTNRYSRAIEDEAWARDQVERVGLGFTLPKVQSLMEELVAV